MQDYLTIMVIALALGLVAGVIIHRADFCMTAAFRDLFLFRSVTLLGALLVLVAASAVLFELARLGGWLVAYPFPLMGPPSLANLLGGVLFGVGMVLAGGCVVGLLYKVGAGCLLCWWGVAGMLLGSLFFAEIYPAWSAFARSTVLTKAVTLPQLTGLSPTVLVGMLVVAATLIMRTRSDCFSTGENWQGVRGYLPPCRAALMLAGVGFISALSLGMPLGVTTSYAKVAGICENLLWPEHFAGLDYFRAQPLKGLVLPLAESPLSGGAGNAFDGIAVIQYPLIVGIVAGSALSAFRLGEWRLISGAPWRQKFWVLGGGILLGMASRMAAGCNIWHLWGGLPILSLASLLFAVGLFPGAWLGGKILITWILPEKKGRV